MKKKSIRKTLKVKSDVINEKVYYIYILKCDNDMLYTGITTDYKRRFLEHKGIEKRGAKFTRSFKPEKIVALWETFNRSNASKLEAQIKKLSKDDKLQLIKNNRYFKNYFDGILDVKSYKRLKNENKKCII